MIKKIKNKTLLKLMTMLIVIFAGATFTACGDDDDDEPSSGSIDLKSVVIGVWSQDGDNDILVIESNGKAKWYDSPSDYAASICSETVNWTLKDNQMDFSDEGEVYQTLIVQTYTKDKIVWDRYEDGEHDVWTWTRYSK